jgi:hypothetical protein
MKRRQEQNESRCFLPEIIFVLKLMGMLLKTIIMLSADISKLNSKIDIAPMVSIVMPFEPMMCSKSKLEKKLQQAIASVQSVLQAAYSQVESLPVISKLMELINKLNYNTHKKSITIFVSPLTEKICYLNIPVEEKIIIDERFGMSDLLRCKKQQKEFLVLLLESEASEMYHGNDEKINLIKLNTLSDVLNEEEFNGNEEEERLNEFLNRIDKDLSLILNAYDLPVFVIGPEIILNKFSDITSNSEKLVAFIDEQMIYASEQNILNKLQPYIENWQKIQQRSILQQIEKAAAVNKLLRGIDEISSANSLKNAKLLLVEESFSFSLPERIFDEVEGDAILPNPFYKGNVIEEVIEKVLENGGDADFVENNLLKHYGGIALIQHG